MTIKANLAERILWLESQLQATTDERNHLDQTEQSQQQSKHRLDVIEDELRKILDELWV